MSVYRRPESCYWWYAISRGRGKPYLRGSTGKTVKAEAEAVEHVLRLAYQKNSTPARLHAMIDTLLGQQKIGLPLSAVWKVYSDWVTSTGRALAEGSLRQRRRICERFAEWAAGNWPSVSFAGEVERACAAGFATWLAGEGARGKTRRNLLGDLSTVWEGLRRVRDDVKVNPWPLVLPHGGGGGERRAGEAAGRLDGGQDRDAV